MLGRMPLGWRLLLLNVGLPLVAASVFAIPMALFSGQLSWLWFVPGAAVFQGVGVTLTLGILHVLSVTDGGESSARGRLSVDQRRVVSLAGSIDAVLVAIEEELVRSGVPERAVASPSPQARSGTTGATFQSWGEVVSVELDGVDGAVEARIRSRPRVGLTMVDYGKNEANVLRIATALSARFPIAEAPPLAPSIRARSAVPES